MYTRFNSNQFDDRKGSAEKGAGKPSNPKPNGKAKAGQGQAQGKTQGSSKSQAQGNGGNPRPGAKPIFGKPKPAGQGQSRKPGK